MPLDPFSIALALGGFAAGIYTHFAKTSKARRAAAAKSLALDTVIAGIELLGRDSSKAALAKSLKVQIQQIALLNGVEEDSLAPAVQDIVDQLEDFGVFDVAEHDDRVLRAANAIKSYNQHAPGPQATALPALFIVLALGLSAVATSGCTAPQPLRSTDAAYRAYYVHEWPADAPTRVDPATQAPYRTYLQDGIMVTVVPVGS